MARAFDWNDLKYFLAVARYGTVSMAGRKLGADHATVGRRVAALEEALNVRLFERTGRGYVLTAPGDRLLARAGKIEAEAIGVEQELAGLNRSAAGRVRIGTLPGFASFYMAAKLADFAADNPNLQIELVSVPRLLAKPPREADITVTIAPPREGRFVIEPLVESRSFIYATRRYLSAAAPIETRADLHHHPFVGYIDEIIVSEGVSYLGEVIEGLDVRFQSSSVHDQIEAVASGFGLCVLPAFIANTRRDLVAVLENDLWLERRYSLVVHEDIAEVARIRAARRFIRDSVTRDRDAFIRPAHRL